MLRRPPAWIAFATLACLFAGWALLRPPLQTPDEPQHLLKATSVRLQPWFNTVPDRFVLDPRSTNPLALETPPALDKLFFRNFNALTREEIGATRQLPWRPDAVAAHSPFQRAIATYPQPYYWAVFLLAEPVVRGASLSPWQATYVYRLVSSLIAAGLWALAYIVLRATPPWQERAVELGAFTVLTPMLAFISSGVNPDAVHMPLCAVAILAAWQSVTEGRYRGTLVLALLGAAFTKPSGVQLAVVLIVALALLALPRLVDRRRAWITIGLIAVTLLVPVITFYLWQPPRFLGAGPSQDTLRQYLAARWDSVPLMWRMYWGQLGWLDYGAAAHWYWLILIAIVVSLASAVLRPQRPATVLLFCGLVWLGFASSTFLGEFRYLDEAGYTFQGRYLLPAAIAMGGLLLHEVRAARLFLLGSIAALHVALVQATVTRYFAEGWAGWWASLPW